MNKVGFSLLVLATKVKMQKIRFFNMGIILDIKFNCDLKSQDPILIIYIRLGGLHNNVMREN